MELELEKRIQELFHQAIELEPRQRAPFVRGHCDNPHIVSRVLALLDHDESAAAEFLVCDENTTDGPTSTPETVPASIGSFRIVGVLGHGGMGTVYRAQQTRPQRTVALKVIRPGLITPAMLRRFDYETHVLARLEHPGIARIYEVGTADTGAGQQPYFAMELVQGRRLDQFVKDSNPSLSERLQLLIDICQAVHHAHTKGVIHRDLKPSNILVTADGKPKILDFGVARAIDSDIQATTQHTQSGQLVGTLPYMAPEQAAGSVNLLDTSSDVYALGVIAFELLSGRLPYSLDGKALHEAVRIICQDEPSRLASIDRNLRGDVETIVQKALEKDRARRYHTAGELAADVKRYLDYQPISARPPSAWYQLSKLARRNKILVGGLVMVMLVLALGVIATSIALVGQMRARAEAQRAKEVADAVNAFLITDVLAGATPRRTPDRAAREAIVRNMLNPAAEKVSKGFTGHPRVESEIRSMLTLAYFELGHAELALPHAQRAMELSRRLYGDDHLSTIQTANNLAGSLEGVGRATEAEALLKDFVPRARRVLGDDDQTTIRCLGAYGRILKSLGRIADSEALAREAATRARRTLGEDHPDTLAPDSQLADTLIQLGRWNEGARLLEEILPRARRVHGPDDPATISAAINLAGALAQTARYAQAESLLAEATAQARRVLGEDHPETIRASNVQAWVLRAQNKLAECAAVLRPLLEQSRRSLGDDHPGTITLIGNLGNLLVALGEPIEAEKLLREATAQSARAMGADHPATLAGLHNLAKALDQLGRADESEALLRDVLERRRRALGEAHPDSITSVLALVTFLNAKGRVAEAEPMLAELYRTAGSAKMPSKLAAACAARYGPCLVKLGRYEQALEPLLEGYRRLTDTGQQNGESMREVVAALVEACDHTGRPEEAAKWREQFAALQPATGPSTTSSN